MRGTTRDPRQVEAIEAAGAEAVLADPDRVVTLLPALDHVAVACLLFGSATGSPEALEALHGPRLEMLLFRLIDTTVHGVLYEARAAAGAGLVRRACERSRIAYTLLESGWTDHRAWTAATADAVEGLIRT